MKKLWAALIIGVLGLGPTIVHAGQLGPAGEQPPEQRQLLNKDSSGARAFAGRRI
jgi:hypothetical protein